VEWDLFICHASEDKETFVDALATALVLAGFGTWYDRSELLLGSRLDREVNRALARCRYGIVVLSPAFFASEWPQRELDGLVALELGGEARILPIWHQLNRRDVARRYPLLAGRRAVSSALGVAAVVSEIERAVRAPARADGPWSVWATW
jgi:hypothetical protein